MTGRTRDRVPRGAAHRAALSRAGVGRRRQSRERPRRARRRRAAGAPRALEGVRAGGVRRAARARRAARSVRPARGARLPLVVRRHHVRHAGARQLPGHAGRQRRAAARAPAVAWRMVKPFAPSPSPSPRPAATSAPSRRARCATATASVIDGTKCFISNAGVADSYVLVRAHLRRSPPRAHRLPARRRRRMV